jgi:hypothetical protein
MASTRDVPAEVESLLAQHEALCDLLRDAGCDVVACVAHYGERGVRFSTRLSVASSYEASEDHKVLDAIREISVEWSNARHEDKLVWADAEGANHGTPGAAAEADEAA